MKWSKIPLFKLAYRQGGIDSFALAQKDVLETMRDDLEKQADELATKKLAELLTIIDEKAVLLADRRGIFIGGVKVEENRLANLKSEAEFLLASDLWKIMYETMKAEAQKTMFVSSQSLVDIQKGKTILFTLATQKNIVELLTTLSPPPIS